MVGVQESELILKTVTSDIKFNCNPQRSTSLQQYIKLRLVLSTLNIIGKPYRTGNAVGYLTYRLTNGWYNGRRKSIALKVSWISAVKFPNRSCALVIVSSSFFSCARRCSRSGLQRVGSASVAQLGKNQLRGKGEKQNEVLRSIRAGPINLKLSFVACEPTSRHSGKSSQCVLAQTTSTKW